MFTDEIKNVEDSKNKNKTKVTMSNTSYKI